MIYQQIKDDRTKAMIDKLPEKEFIKVVISEFDRIGKNLSDAECLKELKKLYKIATSMGNIMEMEYLDKYLPILMGRDEIETQISHYIDSGINNMGQLMGTFNKQFKGKADNKIVKQIVEQLLKN